MRSLALALLCALVLAPAGPAQPANLSEGRGLGFGLQWTGEVFGLSLRYWFSPAVAGELDLFFLPQAVANVALRALWKPQAGPWSLDTAATDLYLGAGVGLLDVQSERVSLYSQGFAGIETSRSTTLAWNLEFGVEALAGFLARETGQLLAVTFGRGVHLYPVP